jgi:hypothetical protein
MYGFRNIFYNQLLKGKLIIMKNKLHTALDGLLLALTLFLLTNFLYIAYLQYLQSPTLTKTQRLHAVYHKILLASGQQYNYPLTIVSSDEVNAYTDGEGVYVYTGLLNKMDTDDEMAMVLGHELGHAIALHNNILQEKWTHGPELESQADMLGTFMMLRAGYDVCKGRDLFLLFMKQSGNCAYCETHPSNIYRYYQESMPWCPRGEV